MRWLWAPVDFVVGLSLLVLLATFAVVSAVLLATGFIFTVLLSEASEMWGALRASLRR